ncbi:MAG: DUF6265 family protein [Sphingorhabdus sp.]
MKSLVVAVALALSPAMAAAYDEGPEFPEWMTGAWVHSDGESWADEYWTPPRTGIMIGASRSGKGEKLQFWEHMRIVKEADGTMAFWAIVGGQKPVRFVATQKTAEEIVFENPGHDHPQRIHYWREGKELKAQISLLDGSKPVEFTLQMMGR